MCPQLNFEEKASASASEGSGPVEEWAPWEASRPRPSYENLVKGVRYLWAPATMVGRVIGNKREAPHGAEVLHRSSDARQASLDEMAIGAGSSVALTRVQYQQEIPETMCRLNQSQTSNGLRLIEVEHVRCSTWEMEGRFEHEAANWRGERRQADRRLGSRHRDQAPTDLHERQEPLRKKHLSELMKHGNGNDVVHRFEDQVLPPTPENCSCLEHATK